MNIVETTQSFNPMINTQAQIESNKIIKENININKADKPSDNITTEVGTTVSSLFFLQDQHIQNDLKAINNIQNDTIPKDTISTSTGTESNGSNLSESSKLDNKKLTFAGKTKQWAGNIWNSIKNIKIFPKTEYQEYRNANGDIVKIPKKKLPLKKKKNVNENVNNRVSQEQNKVITTYHGAVTGLYIVS
jgi:hypothetical protein